MKLADWLSRVFDGASVSMMAVERAPDEIDQARDQGERINQASINGVLADSAHQRHLMISWIACRACLGESETIRNMQRVIQGKRVSRAFRQACLAAMKQCRRCGKPITKERREAFPLAALCFNCAKTKNELSPASGSSGGGQLFL